MDPLTNLPKIAVLAALLFFMVVNRRRLGRALPPFLALFGILLARDVLAIFVHYDIVFVVSDTATALCYMSWLRQIRGKDSVDWVALLLAGLPVIGSLEQAFLGVLPEQVFFRSVWVFLVVGFLIVQMYRVSPFNTQEPEEILKMRRYITQLLLATNSLTLLLDYRSPYTDLAVYPLLYLGHGVILYTLLQREFERRDSEVTTLVATRESLFSFMQNLSAAVTEKMDISRILTMVVESAIKNSQADGGAILMLGESAGGLKFRVIVGDYSPPFAVPRLVGTKSSRLEDYLNSLEIPVGQTVLGETFQKAEPVYIQNAATDQRFADLQGSGMAPSSLVVVPLVVAQRVLGIISVTKRSWGQFFTAGDFEHLRAFADYASLTIDMHLTYLEVLEKQQIEREIGIAAEIQNKLVPHNLPRLSRTQFSVHSLAARGVSGDYFDIVRLDASRVVVLVGDIAGKGVPAALVMVMIHSIFHLIASPTRDIATTLTWINRGLIGQVEIDHYATLSILCYDENTRSVQYANAAHHPLLIYRRSSGQFEQVDTEGLPLGIDRASTYAARNLSLQAGDVALLYTDGVTEAMNVDGEQYGLERLSRVVGTDGDKSADEVVQAIQTDLNQFVGEAKQHDDQTLVVFKAG